MKDYIDMMLKGVKGLQGNILSGMEETYEKLSAEHKETFLKTLQDGGIEDIAKQNAEMVIKANEALLKKND